MTPDQQARRDQILEEALGLDPDACAAYLDDACGGDLALRQEIERLMRVHLDMETGFLDAPPVGLEAPDHRIGQRIGRYELLEHIGTGGMGVVFKAHDPSIDRPVAIKVLHSTAADPRARERFLSEVRTLGRIRHDNVVQVHDVGELGEVPFIVMEFLEGEDLSSAIAGGRAGGLSRKLDIARQIGAALAHVHRSGIVHRDVKPANVFLQRTGRVTLMDFGISRSAAAHTQSKTLLGTLHYLAPEQVRLQPATSLSDLYSFGVLLFELFSGLKPFQGDTAQVLYQVAHEPLPLGPLRAAALPPPLISLIERATAKEPSSRSQRMADLVQELEKISSVEEPTAAREETGVASIAGRRWLPSAPTASSWRGKLLTGLVYRTPRSARGRTWALAAAAVLGLVVAGAGVARYVTLRSGNPIDSIAILPLVNASADANAEYLSDGLTDGLINILSRVPRLRVMARGTVFTYKGKEIDPRTVGRELGVGAVVTGRMVQRRDSLIVQANLANARDGTQIWGERYTRTMADLQDLEDAIARTLAEKLQLDVDAEMRSRLARRHTDNALAYQLYLKGRHSSSRLTIDGLKQGIQLMNQAIALDPTYALAYLGLADAYADASGVYLSTDEAVPFIRAAGGQALRLDPTLVEAHTLLGFFLGYYDRKWGDAEREIRRTIGERPGYARAYEALGLLLMIQGHTDDGIASIQRARDLDPLSQVLNAELGWFYYLARRYNEALVLTEQLRDANPTSYLAHLNLGQIHEQTGRHDKAIAELGQAQALDANPFVWALMCRNHAAMGQLDEARALLRRTMEPKGGHTEASWVGLCHAALGDVNEAFAWLNRAADERSGDLNFLKVDPKFDSLRSDPRFQQLVQRLNLIEKS